MATLTWERVALATGPGEDAEEAVRQAYREAGLAEPELVVVLPSPAAGAELAARLAGGEEAGSGQGSDGPDGQGSDGSGALGSAGSGVGSDGLRLGSGGAGRCVRDELRTKPWERARAAAYGELGHVGWAELWAETGGRLWPQVDRLVGDLRRAIADRGGESLRQVTLDAVLGQHDAPWLSAFDALDAPWLAALGGLDGLKRVAERAGWWWPYERVAIVTERPGETTFEIAAPMTGVVTGLAIVQGEAAAD